MSLNWKEFWNDMARSTDPQDQVGRVGLSDDFELSLIVDHIVDCLQLRPEDSLLDVCCGNGELTRLLALRCERILGIDFSPKLLQLAKKNNELQHLEYRLHDASETHLLNRKFNKINLYFSFQYFESTEKARAVLESLYKSLEDGGILLIGDIPDRRRLWSFYNTPRRKWQYFKSRISGKSSMGRFWDPDTLIGLCEDCGFQATWKREPDVLPYARYRFDVLAVRQ